MLHVIKSLKSEQIEDEPEPAAAMVAAACVLLLVLLFRCYVEYTRFQKRVQTFLKIFTAMMGGADAHRGSVERSTIQGARSTG